MKWNEIEGTEDIEAFLKTFGYFHDSCLKELYMWTESYVGEELSMAVPTELDTNVRILFQRQFDNPSAIELVFEGVTQFHIIPSSANYDSIIYDATLLLQDDTFYWANTYGWKLEDDNSKDVSWIAAKNVKWRDVSSWMGEQMRYGVLEDC
ncbi:hypothetical protein BACCIP111899_01838 [Bacillus rhizoplanae]|uniref:Uncharacterized protein n=1 Tax=Bacillus rhizoplanae TaxID=2880966 RepID=A0ABM8YA78_9BACI|nr:hypothetical protein [Bacillus rhizoplanae]CAG9612661.1 hypothetical protein BACCIP111899_01838 [Bacillus rhizoplanae]